MSSATLTTPNLLNIYSKYAYIQGSRDALSSTHGALVVYGGIAVGKSIATGGSINIGSTNLSSSTSTGALVVNGGIGVKLDANVGGKINILNTDDVDQPDGKPSLKVAGGVTVGKQLTVNSTFNLNDDLTCTGTATIHRLYITSDLPSTSATSGAVRITGGVGIDDNLNISGKITCAGDCSFHRLALTSNLPSSSYTTGALTVGGGIGVGEDIYAHGDGRFDGDVYCDKLHQGSNDDAFQKFLAGLGIVGGLLQIFGPVGNIAGTLISGSCQITGELTKGSGSFLIPHPDPAKEGWKLKHCFVESNTRGDNIYRWRVKVENGKSILELPSYFKFLNENPMVFINPVNMFGQGYGKFTDEQLEITATNDGEYDILVIGTRKDETARKYFDNVGCEIPPQ